MKKITYLLLLILTFATVTVSNAQITDFITGLDSPKNLLLSGNELYISQTNSIIKVDLSMSDPKPVEIASGFALACGIALDDNILYISDFKAGKISKLNIDDPNAIIEDVLTGLSDPNYLLIHDTYLYFSQTNGQSISRIDISSKNPIPEIIVSALRSPIGLAVYKDRLYFTESREGEISSIDLNDISLPKITLTNTDLVRPNGIVVIKDDLFIADFNSNTLFKNDINSESMELTTVVNDLSGPKDCVYYENAVYIVERKANKISRLDYSISNDKVETEFCCTIFPNPSREFINISNNTNVEYIILTAQGQIVKRGEISPNQRINISNLENGLYLLMIDNKTTKKLIKY